MFTDNIIISKLQEFEVSTAALLLAESMCTNPNHIFLFGEKSFKGIEMQQKMFKTVLTNPANNSFTAKMNGEIIGSMTYTDSKHCQMPKKQLLFELPKYARLFGWRLPKVIRWRANWEGHDCTLPHLHFGPLGVATTHQGKGVGKVLLRYFCDSLDENNQIGYLETDKEVNVLFYEKFGFQVIEEDILFGSPNWFMVRETKINSDYKWKDSSNSYNLQDISQKHTLHITSKREEQGKYRLDPL